MRSVNSTVMFYSVKHFSCDGQFGAFLVAVLIAFFVVEGPI